MPHTANGQNRVIGFTRGSGRTFRALSLSLLAGCVFSACTLINPPKALAEPEELRVLPKPKWESGVSVEQAIRSRRSIRAFTGESLSLADVSQLLWAAQGITGYRFRAAPSAGALYPLELRLVVGDVEGLPVGVYRYVPEKHALERTVEEDVRESLGRAALWQDWVGTGAVVLVFSAVYERTTKKYGDRGVRYAHMEVGHAGQNVYLQAQALGLGTTMVGAFMDDWVSRLLHMADEEQPLAIMPVGRPG